MNNWNGIGRLTADPETRYTSGDNPLCVSRYTLAVDRSYKKQGEPDADFIRCVAFGKQGEFAEKHLTKGMKVGVTGRIQTGSYKDKEGRTVYTTDIIVNEHTFCEKKETAKETAAPPTDEDGFMSIPDGIDEELPFS